MKCLWLVTTVVLATCEGQSLAKNRVSVGDDNTTLMATRHQWRITDSSGREESYRGVRLERDGGRIRLFAQGDDGEQFSAVLILVAPLKGEDEYHLWVFPPFERGQEAWRNESGEEGQVMFSFDIALNLRNARRLAQLFPDAGDDGSREETAPKQECGCRQEGFLCPDSWCDVGTTCTGLTKACKWFNLPAVGNGATFGP